jgi:two-component system sensor histidine kinase BaeS
MRRRLTVVLVLLMAGTLIAAGAGTLLITRRAARDDAARQLLAQANVFSHYSNDVRSYRKLAVVDTLLKLEGGRIIAVSPAGDIPTPLPADLTPAELDPQRLLDGDDVSGLIGTLAFAAVPVSLAPPIALAIPPGRRYAIVLTRQVGSLGPSWFYFLLVSGVTLVVAAAVAAALTRRITRSLIEASAVTGRIAAGELDARVVTNGGDYPEVVSLAESINSMAERLSGGRERERQLLLSVSHDLRTPLTSIRGYAEAIQEGVASDAAAAAGVIVNESRRLERLVADLLDLARLGADRLSLHIAPTDVCDVVSETLRGFRPTAESVGLTLSSFVGDPGLLVEADPDRLAQVIANLVENSLGFARRTVTVSIVSSSASPSAPATSVPRPPAGFVLVLVEDDGPGIAGEDLGRVFDRFYQADRGAAARRGVGLGLSIVAELVRAMGGQVRAESPITDGRGTRMVVALRAWSTASGGPLDPGSRPFP